MLSQKTGRVWISYYLLKSGQAKPSSKRVSKYIMEIDTSINNHAK